MVAVRFPFTRVGYAVVVAVRAGARGGVALAGVDDPVVVGVGLAFIGDTVGIAVVRGAHVQVADIADAVVWQSAWLGLGNGQLSQMSITPSPSASGWHSSGTPLKSQSSEVPVPRSQTSPMPLGWQSVWLGFGSEQLSQPLTWPSLSASGSLHRDCVLALQSSDVPEAMSQNRARRWAGSR